MIATNHHTALLQTESHTAVVLKTLQLLNLLPSYPENLNNMQKLVAYSPVIYFPSSPDMAISKNSMRALMYQQLGLACSALSSPIALLPPKRMQRLTVNTPREHPQRLFNFRQIANSQSGALHPQDLQSSFLTTCRNSKEKRNEETQQLNRIAQGPM
jgi:hypothetical protein